MCWVNKNMKNHQFKLKGKEKKRNRKTPFTAPLGFVEFEPRAAAEVGGLPRYWSFNFEILGFRQSCRGTAFGLPRQVPL